MSKNRLKTFDDFRALAQINGNKWYFIYSFCYKVIAEDKYYYLCTDKEELLFVSKEDGQIINKADNCESFLCFFDRLKRELKHNKDSELFDKEFPIRNGIKMIVDSKTRSLIITIGNSESFPEVKLNLT